MSHQLPSLLARKLHELKSKFGLIESQVALFDVVLQPLLEARRAERQRQAQLKAAQAYSAARWDKSWTGRLTTARGAKRHELRKALDDSISQARRARDVQYRDTQAWHRFNDEAKRLSSLVARH